MSECQNCGCSRVLSVTGKCDDRFSCKIQTDEGSASHDGYVPDDLGIGSGDYLEFDLCLECGQVQGDFPLGITELEEEAAESEEDEEDPFGDEDDDDD